MADPERLNELRQRLAALDGIGGLRRMAAVSLGVDALDRALPWGGLPRVGVHEVRGGDVLRGARDGAASGFVAMLAGRVAAGRGPVLWCRPAEGRRTVRPYGPGLWRFGLDPAWLLFADPPTIPTALWTLEEALRSGCLAAVIAEGLAPDATAARRLHLAAERGETPALLLSPDSAGADVALTRWRVTAATTVSQGDGAAPGRCRWHVALLRCRGGAPGNWLVDWTDETHCLYLVSVLGDRPQPAPGHRVA